MPDVSPASVTLCETCRLLLERSPNVELADLLKLMCSPCRRRARHALNAAEKPSDDDGFKPLK